MAWTFHRSTLDRYCPKFEPEYPPGIDFFTTSLTKVGQGQPIEAATLPKRMRQTSSHKQLPDFLTLNAQPVVSAAFRRVVEALEPNINEFFPIEVLDRNGSSIEGEYFVLNELQRLDAVIIELSNVSWITRPDGTRVPMGVEKKFVVDRQRINGKHLWRNSPFFTQYRFVSNALKDRIESARIQKLSFIEIIEASRV